MFIHLMVFEHHPRRIEYVRIQISGSFAVVQHIRILQGRSEE